MDLLRTAIAGRVVRNHHAFVVHEIGTAIVKGEYPVGSLLPGDAELAERFAVSRTVLREAMKTLSAKGLVFARARIGTRVTERTQWNLFDADVLTWHFEAGVSLEFLGHLAEMRLSFEPFAARLTTQNATSDELAQLYDITEKMAAAPSKEAFALADLEFHMALLGASKNPFMYSVGNLIEAALVSAFKLSSPVEGPSQRESAQQHRAIVEAIDAKDADTAAAAMETVIIVGRDRVSGRIGKTAATAGRR
ncbi:FadR/GntR family transcriptional regulator [Chelativorans sp. M5D2P16]|uniref:FadR/GntR family transcriptional regulator n=1 Tax=Chelativorans sp. M5D2P16 TaxID=3095678 RepID=UPI002ACA2932|nr:FadR/GntR family transcriptional regulator [Chelativorans sp. M5D2P16]MDZ5699621.1 FadR/GntR family transcriptional regulator [Chelativorans sp. M5D2P16]